MKWLFFLCAISLQGEVREVSTDAGLREAIGALEAGDTLRIAPGDYAGGWSVAGVANLTVEGADRERPPVFRKGKTAWQFSRCPHLTVRDLACEGQEFNGFNLDDGGNRGEPCAGVTLERLRVSDIGPDGNFDGIKCSGLDKLVIRGCEISGWGGQAIDLVGCHDVLISGCVITGKDGFSQHTGPQFKGGCEDVVMEDCRLTNAGQRPIQIGGSTGMDYFRPVGAKFEARRVTARRNVITGSPCAVAFTGAVDCEVASNVIVRPEKWVMRILQETREPDFPPCGNNRFHHNVIVLNRGQVREEVNIGPGTAAETFSFSNNLWFAADQPGRSVPRLPAAESGGHHGIDPGLQADGSVTAKLAREVLAGAAEESH